ncbi:MAG: ectonucleotide pyrophosphatase/phosphodiesterase [Pyrinomonadaceae bacterium]
MKRFGNAFQTTIQLCLVTAILQFYAFSQKPVSDLKPTVILISLDGFRYDYLDKYSPPTLNKLAKQGVRAKWMTPSFPTKTFPNHYTVATGLYPAHHGIVENNIWDFGVTFGLGKREEVQNSRWWLGEPIWVAAEKQGLRAAAFFFPGTEAEIAGKRPTFWKQYDGKIPNNDRVDQILAWLDLQQVERPRMYTLYFSDVDDAGHGFSPDSEETKKAVQTVDENVRRLMDGLRVRKIDRKINVIIVSDHGMATVDQKNAIVMDDYLDNDKTERVLTTGEIWQIFPKAGLEDQIMAGLKPIQHAVCWRKADIPARLHYRNSLRIAPIVCSANEGWFMTSRERYETQKKRADFERLKGAHGYDNKYESMRAIFVGHGKAFKKKKVVEAFDNIHVYELMCKILGLKPAKNDGDLNRVRGMLR